MPPKDVPTIDLESKDTLAGFGASLRQLEPIGAAGCCCTLGCASPFATDTGAAVNTYEAGCKGA